MRSHSPWVTLNKTDKQYAILPVLPAQIQLTVSVKEDNERYNEIFIGESNVKNKEETARVINNILNNVAAGSSNSLRGPDETESILKKRQDWQYLEVYLQDPAPLNEPWKRKGLAEISLALKTPFVLRVSPTLQFEPNIYEPVEHDLSYRYMMEDAGVGDMGRHWKGRITIDVEMLDLANTKVMTCGAGEAYFYGHVGVLVIGNEMGGIAIPYAFGKIFDDAVDKAVRNALDELFDTPLKDGTVQ